MPLFPSRLVGRTIALAALVASVAISPACAADKLRVGTPEAAGFNFGMLDAGVELGIFKKYDLDIERIDLGGGARLHQAMNAGALDMAIGGGTDLQFLAKGSPEKCVAAMGKSPANLAITVRADSAFTTIGNLKGKKIGVSTVGSLTSWLAKEASRYEGWGPNGMVIVPLGGMTSNLAALTAGTIDALSGSLEVSYVVQAEGKVRILLKGGDFVHDFVASVIYASDATIAGRPDAVRRFLKAWFESVQYLHDHKPETVRLMAKIMAMPPAIIANIYDDEMPSFSLDGRIDHRALGVVKQALADFGLIERMPDDSALLNETFLP
jgi:ABC-type nitrate/sulfonate/bicarbonate transport system substrate-binding protein